MKLRRNGSMLLEVSLAVMLATVAMIAVAQILAVAARQRHDTRCRTVATREVANLAEQLMGLPWEQTNSEQLGTTAIHPGTLALLPDATLDVEVSDTEEPRPAKRLRISLSYRNTAGLPVEPVTLVAWKFASGGAE